MKRSWWRSTSIRRNVTRALIPSLAVLVLTSFGAAQAATISVSAGSDAQANGDSFQGALQAAACGDIIVLQAGGTYASRMSLLNSYGPQGNAFTAPNKNCPSGQYVTIQTSALANLPAGRVTYADIPNMATLATNSNAPAITYAGSAGWYKWIGILFTNTANVPNVNGFIPTLVDTAQAGYAPPPHDIVYDRVVIRPYEESLNPIPNTFRSAGFGIRLDGQNMTIQNSYIAGFCCTQTDDKVTTTQSVGLGIVGGSGPYTINNNFIEAYGWNLFTGGGSAQPQNTATLTSATLTTATLSNTTNLKIGDAIRFLFSAGIPDPTCCANGGNVISNPPPLIYASATVTSISGTSISFTWMTGPTPTPTRPPDAPGEAAWNGVNPSNLTITRNLFHKRTEWASNSGQCKSFWEMKSGSNVLFEGNTLTGPVDARSGVGCPINTTFATNQNGSNPWAAAKNNVFKNNLMLGVGSIFATRYDSYCSLPTDAADNMTFSNNLMGAIPRYAFWLNTKGGSNWVITHNTVRGNSNSIFHPNCENTNLTCMTSNITFRDNIVDSGGYYIQTLDMVPTQYPGMIQDHNVIINNTSFPPPPYTSTDFVANSASAVGFVNFSSADAGDDYHGYVLSSSSPYKGQASDGTDPGVNFNTLDTALTSAGGSGSTGGSGSAGGATPAAPSNLTVR